MEHEKLTVRKSRVFDRWLGGLNDRDARGRITARIVRLENGSWGDVRSISRGLFELRIDCGPGYRLYGMKRSAVFVVLLCGGDKGSQQRDIERAARMARRIAEGGFYEKPV
ncbi:type II toxin-antitoxin system RelE/ParE family toxin [Eggerthella sinensis]|uniref:type II toxin-antitoxin system RelE/ParE family toxin n=1 Tax=Eggerthella sinensis TaxID=242230 RepID=UPI00248E31DD|nr:type II toxin-antitoxin system RelE/ParE family toxin [Eggerthella sinensis]